MILATRATKLAQGLLIHITEEESRGWKMVGLVDSKSAHRIKAEQFERMTKSLRPQLLRNALRLTRNPADAEDLVQDTYLRAFRFFDRFTASNRILPWLYKIQKSIFINQFRSRRRRQESLPLDRTFSVEELDVPSEGRLHEMTPEEYLVEEEFDREIRTLVEGIPEQQQAIFVLATFHEKTYEEIAAALDCPIGTVRSRLSRAKESLRGRFESHAASLGFATN